MALKFNPFSWGKKNKNNPQLEKDVEQLKQQVQTLTAELQTAQQKIQLLENNEAILNVGEIAFKNKMNNFTTKQIFPDIQTNTIFVNQQLDFSEFAGIEKLTDVNFNRNPLILSIRDKINQNQIIATSSYNLATNTWLFSTLEANSKISINGNEFGNTIIP